MDFTPHAGARYSEYASFMVVMSSPARWVPAYQGMSDGAVLRSVIVSNGPGLQTFVDVKLVVRYAPSFEPSRLFSANRTVFAASGAVAEPRLPPTPISTHLASAVGSALQTSRSPVPALWAIFRPRAPTAYPDFVIRANTARVTSPRKAIRGAWSAPGKV